MKGFIPDALPPVLSLPLQTATTLSRAENLLGRLDGMTDALPNPSILVRAFIRREAAVSSYIEDTFEAYEEEYYDALLAVSQEGEWLPWIDFFLRGMAAASANVGPAAATP